MKDKKVYIILIISLLFTIIGVSFAFFSLNVIGNDTAKTNKVVSGNLELTFTDTTEISLENIIPGDSVEKVIKVKNTGTKEVSYNIGWTDYTNEITNNELVIEGTCKRLNSSNTEEGTCNSISQKEITSTNFAKNIKIEPGITHEYTLKITFIDTGENQNYNVNKSFNAKINVSEGGVQIIYCTYDGDLVQGATYVNGQYTYNYKQKNIYNKETGEISLSNISDDGWGVTLTDKDSTDAVTSNVCTYINDKPIISMSLMYAVSQATSIDLSSFNTSNVTDMSYMFAESQVATLDLSGLNTKKVKYMNGMFWGSQAKVLDLSSFDTSEVVDMNLMFGTNEIEILDLSSFDTSKVTDMNAMFSYDINLKKVYVSNKFNIDNVTDSEYMFESCTSLVGGAGTTYDSTKTDKTYARIDGGTSNPGYFTSK